MRKRFLVTMKVLVSEEAGRTLRGLPRERQPIAMVRFLSAQSLEDLGSAVVNLRCLPWTESGVPVPGDLEDGE